MTIIKVNPVSVREYGTTASQQFAHCRTELEALVREAVEVRYYGPNAVQFKTDCGRLAAEFSAALLRDLQQIADAVRDSTTRIIDSLGGAPVVIAVDGSPVAVPGVPAFDGTYDLDTSALDALKPMVTRHVAAIHQALTENVGALTRTEWEGEAKQAAVDVVTRFAEAAKTRATEAETKINAFVDSQIQSTVAADR